MEKRSLCEEISWAGKTKNNPMTDVIYKVQEIPGKSRTSLEFLKKELMDIYRNIATGIPRNRERNSLGSPPSTKTLGMCPERVCLYVISGCTIPFLALHKESWELF